MMNELQTLYLIVAISVLALSILVYPSLQNRYKTKKRK